MLLHSNRLLENMGIEVINHSVMAVGCLPSDISNHPPSMSIHLPNKAKRSLFGPVDHEEVMSFLAEELAKMEENAKNKWNYDFANDKPHNEQGLYIWEPIDNVGDLPKIEDTIGPNTVTKSRKIKPICKRSKKQTHSLLSVMSKDLTQTLIKDFMKCSKNSSVNDLSDCVVLRKKLCATIPSHGRLLRSRKV